MKSKSIQGTKVVEIMWEVQTTGSFQWGRVIIIIIITPLSKYHYLPLDL